MSLIVLILTQLITCRAQYYLASQFALSWDNANKFCQTQCNSQLASIHDKTQNEMVIDMINNFNSDNTWIGLRQSGGPYEWSDNSIMGYIPVTTNTSSWNNDCITISSQNNFAWTSELCTVKQQFLCNSCDGIINKYILGTDGNMNFNNAKQYCFDRFGTTLASIHSERDNQEAITLCKIYDQSCFIGLTDAVSENNFEYEDSTDFDFNQWSSNGFCGQPDNGCVLSNEDCVELRKDYSFEWNDQPCDREQTFLCNMQSELCFQQYWYILTPNSSIIWHPVTSPIKCEINIDGDGDNMMIMTGKQWINSNKLTVEYTFSILNGGVFGNSGILFDFMSVCEYMYIGIEATDIDYTLFIRQIQNDRDSDNYQVLNSTLVSYTIGTYYTMSISVDQNRHFQISINNEIKLTYNYNDILPSNELSGYIGIINNNLSINAKYLYVSGSKTFLNDQDKISQFTIGCTRAPTSPPTILPTISHTIFSTIDADNDSQSTSNENTNTVTIVFVVLFVIGIIVILIIIGYKYHQKKKQIDKNNHNLEIDIAMAANPSKTLTPPGTIHNTEEQVVPHDGEGMQRTRDATCTQAEGYTKMTKKESTVHLQIIDGNNSDENIDNDIKDENNEDEKNNAMLQEMLSDVMEMKSLDPNKIHEINDKQNNDTESDDSDNMYDEQDVDQNVKVEQENKELHAEYDNDNENNKEMVMDEMLLEKMHEKVEHIVEKKDGKSDDSGNMYNEMENNDMISTRF